MLGIVLALAILALVVAATVSLRKSKSGWGTPGPGAMGTVYDMLNEDRRKAIEIIVEQRAEERDPESADGNLPDLAGTSRGRESTLEAEGRGRSVTRRVGVGRLR